MAKERWEMSHGIILNNPQYCELCLCTCMSSQNVEEQHYINLEPSLSDVAGGFVVSAVKFVQEDRVLSLAVSKKSLAFIQLCRKCRDLQNYTVT